MEMKLRKLWPLIGALCVTAFSSAFAQSNYSSSGSSTYGSGMDSSSGAQSGQGTYQRGTFREITPSAGPRVAHGADVFITANFLWWGVNQNGLNYAVSAGFAPSDGNDAFASASRGKSKYIGHDWTPGFRVGLGLNMSHDGWDIFTQYTWLRPSHSNIVSNTTNGVTFTLGSLLPEGAEGPTTLANIIKGSWNLNFNVIDVELGRNFYLSQYLTMRPFIGFKGTWQDQDVKVTSVSDNYSIPFGGQDIPVTGPFVHKRKLDNWGLGVRGGFNLAWFMAKNWSIYGNLAFTSMWTNYDKISATDTLQDNAVGSINSKTYVNIQAENFYTVKYVTESEIGLRYDVWFYDDNYHFAVQAGWEQQVWINWATFQEVLDHTWNDLTLHGLNLKFRFDF